MSGTPKEGDLSQPTERHKERFLDSDYGWGSERRQKPSERLSSSVVKRSQAIMSCFGRQARMPHC